ncbi:MAG: electron transfer flavoprotein-ubiquinone oxidoreductase, partial [Alphaproteobacteria bacterium]
PQWRDAEPRLGTPVSRDRFVYLGPAGALSLPGFLMPPQLNNHGTFIVSLANVCRWLAGRAEALGVEIYPGFAATELLFEDGHVTGVATGDMGVGRDGERKPGFARGIELQAKYVLLAEGARGSLAKQAIRRFGLDEACEPPKFGLGIKELWEVAPHRHTPGLVQHSLGWPLGSRAGGGGFIYHMDGNQVAIGFVTHLNYADPYMSPFEEMQRFKTHPTVRPTFEGGRRIAYGARVIAEGGWQSVPRLSFPGGALIGCAAGLVNVPRIKGTHNAIASGMQVATHVQAALARGEQGSELTAFDTALREGTVGRDLRSVRNVKPLLSRFGLLAGTALGGLDMWANALGFSFFGTMAHGKADHAALRPASEFQPIDYPSPDGVLTFDRLSSVFLSNTNHEEDQPVHLQLGDPAVQKSSEHDVFAGLSARYCPAGVYEWVQDAAGTPRFVINAQNCVHCKTCDIKDPNQNLTWVPPEGAGGPNYPNM